MSKLSRKLCLIAIISIIAYGMILGSPAVAQVTTVESEYIGLGIGTGGVWSDFLEGAADWRIGGRFHIWTNRGDPTTSDDDGIDVNYSPVGIPGPAGSFGAFQVMVDGWAVDSETTDRAWCMFPNGGTSGIWGDVGEEGDGYWTLVPYVPSNENVIRAVWYPAPESGLCPVTYEEVEVIPPSIRCELEARVMRDTVRFKFTFTNTGIREHMVGLRSYADLEPSLESSGTRDLRNIVSIPGHRLLENRTVLMGREIPPVIEMFNSQMDPTISIRLTFSGQGATPPDVVGIDNWNTLASGAWTYWYGMNRDDDPWLSWRYQPIPYTYIADVGYGAFWKPRRLTPGQSMTIIHYIGLASATSDFTKPNMDVPQYVASVQGPRTLKYYTDNDTATGELYPNPMRVDAYMLNTEKYIDFHNAAFTLTLPPGLTLHPSEHGKYTKAIPLIQAGREGRTSWYVIPEGSPTGILNYSVSFSAGPVGGTTLSREINIPATEWQPLPAGWQMISVPFDLTNSDPQHALGLYPGHSIYRYDRHLRQYFPVTRMEPGEAYWLRLNHRQTTSMRPGEYEPIPWARNQGYTIPLSEGWNMVGNPYVYAITLGELRFYTRDLGVMDYDQAMSRGLISPTVFWWDPVFRTYRWNQLGERSVQFKPWQGYWVRALRPDITMIVTPLSQIGASIGGEPIEDDDDFGGGDEPLPPPTPDPPPPPEPPS